MNVEPRLGWLKAVWGPAPGCSSAREPHPRVQLSLYSRLSVWSFVDICNLMFRKVRDSHARHKEAWKLPSSSCWVTVVQLQGPVYFLSHFCCLKWDVRGSQYVDKSADFGALLGISFLCLYLVAVWTWAGYLSILIWISLLVQQDNNVAMRRKGINITKRVPSI